MGNDLAVFAPANVHVVAVGINLILIRTRELECKQRLCWAMHQRPIYEVNGSIILKLWEAPK